MLEYDLLGLTNLDGGDSLGDLWWFYGDQSSEVDIDVALDGVVTKPMQRPRMGGSTCAARDIGMGVHRQPLGCGGTHATNTTGYMALSWKLVIDSTNAPALADFWAAALEYEVEDPSALIKQLLAAGSIGEEAVVEHRGRKTFRGYAAIRHPEDSFDQTSGVGRGRRLLFQDVPESKSGKNRLHIDVHSEPGGLDKLVARLDELGATRVREVDMGPAGHWWIMQDPEGNEFCAA